MKRMIKHLFSRSATAPLLLGTDSGAGPIAINNAHAEPKTAKLGTSCSTHAFLTVQDHIEWLAGHQGSDGKWSIRKITEMPNISGRAVPVGEVVQKTTTQQTGLSFFGAIKVLAAYEQGQLALHVVPVDLDDAVIKSGHDHYAGFAEREGIVFDTAGEPYPTVNGDVVGDGVFTKAALERARAVYRKQSSLRVHGNDFLGAIFRPLTDTSDTFAKTIQAAVNVTYLQDVITRLQKINNLIECSLFKNRIVEGFSRSIMRMDSGDFQDAIRDDQPRNELIYRIRMLLRPGGQTIPQAVQECVSQIHDILPKIEIEGFNTAIIAANVDALSLYFEVGAVRSPTLIKHHSPENLRYAYLQLADSVQALEEKFQALGGEEADLWKIKSALLENEPDLAKPKAIDDFITGLIQLRDQIDQNKKKTTNMVVAGPHLKNRTTSMGPR